MLSDRNFMRDTNTIDLKKYVLMQQLIDEIGRMLGGWIKSTASKSESPPPPRGTERRKKEVPNGRQPDVVVGIVIPVVVDVEPTVVPVEFDTIVVGHLTLNPFPSVITAD
jgi:hypothetical protein